MTILMLHSENIVGMFILKCEKKKEKSSDKRGLIFASLKFLRPQGPTVGESSKPSMCTICTGDKHTKILRYRKTDLRARKHFFRASLLVKRLNTLYDKKSISREFQYFFRSDGSLKIKKNLIF